MPARKTTYDNRRGKDEPKRRQRIDDTEVNRKIIMGLAKQGHSLDRIADIAQVSKTYLKTHYANEIKNGREIANALVTENIYQQAMKDSPAAMPAAMFIAKTRMGWKEERGDENRSNIIFDFSSLTYEERAALKERLIAKISGPADSEPEGEIIDMEPIHGES